MASKFKEVTDKQLVDELHRRFDHVCIELIRDLDDDSHICRDKYKGQLDPAYEEEWVDADSEDSA